VAPEWPAFQVERHRLNRLVGLREFDFLRWGAEAMVVKARAHGVGGHKYLAKDERRELVLEYLALMRETQLLQGQINEAYVDFTIEDPDVETRKLQQELAMTRDELLLQQPLAEAIIEEQVSAVMVQEGFGTLEALWPPLKMRMTPLPLVLVVSPRDEIRQVYNITLLPDLTVPERDALEEAIFEELDLSALVVPIGGLGMYPSMIIETSNVNFLADVVAHEWMHHWLTMRPLGIRYLASPEMRTINETVASIVGTEIGEAVIERYYPQYVPPEAPDPDGSGESPEDPPQRFDFRAEMAQTRIRVDELLAQGEVEAAEAYMEERRELFVTNGYSIRKLNQAYFAFYGAYADVPGATGADPIGPLVNRLRQESNSLFAFAQTVSRVTSFEDLQTLVEGE
ncbi:MAG: hypothetical protein ACOCXI_03370, partial [Chloroflexota bacterium]